MDQARRRVAGHFTGRFPYQVRPDARLQKGPLWMEGPDMFGELFETLGIAGNVVPIIEVLVDQDMHPGEQKCDVGARTDGQPVSGFSGRYREARVDGDDAGILFQCLDPCLYLAVVEVFSQVRANQHDAAGVLHVGSVG